MDPPLPQHGVPEHLLRRVHPVLFGVVTGDGGLLSGGGQLKGLVWRWHLVWRRHLHREASEENSTGQSQPETPAVRQLWHTGGCCCQAHQAGCTYHICWVNVTVVCRSFHGTTDKLVGPVLVGGPRLCLVHGVFCRWRRCGKQHPSVSHLKVLW